MFNRTVVLAGGPSRTEYVTRDVHEHRAPTDESVRLLREMEEKARKEVLKSITVGDTTFNCVVHYMREHSSQVDIYKAIFSLSGKKIEVTYRHEYWQAGDPKAWVVALRDEIAKEIANQLLAPALDQLKKAW